MTTVNEIAKKLEAGGNFVSSDRSSIVNALGEPIAYRVRSLSGKDVYIPSSLIEMSANRSLTKQDEAIFECHCDWLGSERSEAILIELLRREPLFSAITESRDDAGINRVVKRTHRDLLGLETARISAEIFWNGGPDDLGFLYDYYRLLRRAVRTFCARLGVKPNFNEIETAIRANNDHDVLRVHTDNYGRSVRALTTVYYVSQFPRKFFGGQLVIYDLDRKTGRQRPRVSIIEPDSDVLVVFPSNTFHEVLEVNGCGERFEHSRFVVNSYFHYPDISKFTQLASQP